MPRALILGGTGAIGRATARRLLTADWRVDLTGRNPDPDAPSARRIARTVARHLDHAWEEILLDGNELGRHPWDKPHPVVLDMTAALDLGYAPAGDYAATVTEEIDWLVSAARGGADADLLPELGLDYQAEDRWLRSKRSAHDEDQGT
jgi:NAD(P)-dependent dehydrogenase (short-subunit alcohol dehydrogenase family)